MGDKPDPRADATQGASQLDSRRHFLAAGVAVVAASAATGLSSDPAQASGLLQEVYSGTAGIPAWAPGTTYSVNQLISSAGAVYVCATAHTSGPTFPGIGSDWQGTGFSPLTVSVDALGADPTGASDSTAAFNAAIATGRQVVLGAGSYKVGTASDLTAFGRNQGMTGMGSALTELNYVGTGTCLRAFDPNFGADVSFGGSFKGFSIEGSNAAAGAVGFSWGNLNAGRCHDITIDGFSGAGSIGLLFKNGTAPSAGWSEQAEWTAIRTTDNTNNVVFDTGSFDYGIYEFLVHALADQNGITLQNGALLQGVRLELRGNFTAATSNTGWVMAIDPSGTGSANVSSLLSGAQLFVNVECNGSSGVGHTTIKLGGADSSSLSGVGVLNFLSAGAAFTGASLSVGIGFGFSGVLNEPTLNEMASGDGLVVHGGTSWTEFGSLSDTAYNNMTIYPELGDIQAFLLPNGAISINRDAPFQGEPYLKAKRLELFFRQPSAAPWGTIEWPGNVRWAGGEYALSAAPNAIDRVTLTYLPSEQAWFGKVDQGFV